MTIQQAKQLPIVLIPSYKPDEQLVSIVQQIKVLSDYHVIIVDDGNPKQSAQMLFEGLARMQGVPVLHHLENRGKGAALKTGFVYIQQHFPDSVGVVTADADGQHLVQDIIGTALQLELTPEALILGTRQFDQADVPWRSRFGNQWTAKLFQLVTGMKCPDTQTGLRGIPQSRLNDVIHVKGERFDYEMNQLLALARSKVNFYALPIQTVYLEGNRSSHFHPLRDSLRIIVTMLQFGLASSIGTIIDFGLFWGLSQWFGMTTAIGLLISSVLARMVAGIVNYNLNVRWVFKTTHNLRRFTQYVGLFIGQLIVSSLVVTAITLATRRPLLVKLIVDSLLFMLSYHIQQRYIFARPTAIAKQHTIGKGVALP